MRTPPASGAGYARAADRRWRSNGLRRGARAFGRRDARALSGRRQDARATDRRREFGSDAGSVLPLVLGMMVCVLLLGAGVTAATSAFLARGRLQHSCDGAVAAAADAAHRTRLLTGAASADTARSAALDYLAARDPATQVEAGIGGGAGGAGLAAGAATAVELRCTATSPITFGSLFGAAQMTMSVRAVGRSVLAAEGP